MKIFIACSKYFYNRVMPIKLALEIMGHEVTLPNCFDNPFEEEQVKEMGLVEHASWKCEMMKRHEFSLRCVDAILVLNFRKKGIPNYIGGATFMEVIKAWELEKKIYFWNPLPNCSFTDELRGMCPIVINKDLRVVE